MSSVRSVAGKGELTSPARYFCLLRIVSYTFNFASNVVLFSSARASSPGTPRKILEWRGYISASWSSYVNLNWRTV